MPATALATRPAPPAALPPRVPVEFIGLARQFRNKVVAEEQAFLADIGPMVAPLRPRPRFRPVPRQALLKILGRAWRDSEPLGRLDLVVKYVKPRLDLIDIRAVPAKVYCESWPGDDEPALAIIVDHLGIAPPAPLRESSTMLASLGLHALARRFQRGADRSDDAVKADLLALAHAAPDAVIDGGEFEIATPSGGRWVGAVVDTYALVRTFL
jgi:hypothetical protein